MHYDPESNIISLEITGGKIDHVIELGNFLIHVNKNQAPLLIEILDGGKFVSQFSKGEEKKFIPTPSRIPSGSAVGFIPPPLNF